MQKIILLCASAPQRENLFCPIPTAGSAARRLRNYLRTLFLTDNHP